MKTKTTKKSEIKRAWHLIDVKDKILGRVTTQVAQLLIGKNKVYFTPHLDCGDYVVVINAGQIKVTGKKADQKVYYRHSGYPGGFREVSFKEQMEKDPRQIIRSAVKSMLPKNKLRDPRLARLKIFTDDKHSFQDKLK